MKKMLFVLLVSMVGIATMAQDKMVTTTTTTHKYYYYPSYNVYYDDASGNYWYRSGTDWTETHALPSTIVIEKTSPRYHIMYRGDDPWKNNAVDMKKYKAKGRTIKSKSY